MGKSYIMHDFFCLNCGTKAPALMRKTNKLKGEGHRKKLYCFNCKETVNHMECRDEEEIKKFKENFASGLYKTEAQKSIEFIKEEDRNYGSYW